MYVFINGAPAFAEPKTVSSETVVHGPAPPVSPLLIRNVKLVFVK